METKLKTFKKKYLYLALMLFFAIALSIIFFFLIFNAKDINIGFGILVSALKPFIYGGVIAYILIPICKFYEKNLKTLYAHIKTRKIKDADEKKALSVKAKASFHSIAESISIALALGTLVLIIYVLLSLIIPELIVSLTIISKNFDTYYNTATNWFHNIFKDNEFLLNYYDEIFNKVSTAAENYLKNELLPNATTIISNFSSGIMSAFSFLKNLLIGIIVSIYFMKMRDNFCAQARIFLHSIMKAKYANKIIEEVNFANDMFIGFICGRILDSAIIAVICFLGMTIFGMPYPLLISVIIGITNIIPFFGPFIGVVPAVFLILMVSPGKCIGFIIFFIILQQADGNIIGPAILGEMTNLNSFWVLFALMLFSGLFGFTGMIIGVPVFAVIYHLVQELIMKGLKRHGYEPQGEEAELSGYNAYQKKLADEKLKATNPEAYKMAHKKENRFKRFILKFKKEKKK